MRSAVQTDALSLYNYFLGCERAIASGVEFQNIGYTVCTQVWFPTQTVVP